MAFTESISLNLQKLAVSEPVDPCKDVIFQPDVLDLRARLLQPQEPQLRIHLHRQKLKTTKY